jgi:hypothetical protein
LTTRRLLARFLYFARPRFARNQCAASDARASFRANAARHPTRTTFAVAYLLLARLFFRFIDRVVN